MGKDLMTRREADAAPRETRETKMAKARSQKVRSQKVRSQQKVISQLVVRSQQKPRLPRRNREVATRTAKAKAPVTKARSQRARSQKAKTETAKEERREERRARSPGMMSRKSSLMLSPMRSKESSQTKNLPKNSPEVPS